MLVRFFILLLGRFRPVCLHRRYGLVPADSRHPVITTGHGPSRRDGSRCGLENAQHRPASVLGHRRWATAVVRYVHTCLCQVDHAPNTGLIVSVIDARPACQVIQFQVLGCCASVERVRNRDPGIFIQTSSHMY